MPKHFNIVLKVADAAYTQRLAGTVIKFAEGLEHTGLGAVPAVELNQPPSRLIRAEDVAVALAAGLANLLKPLRLADQRNLEPRPGFPLVEWKKRYILVGNCAQVVTGYLVRRLDEKAVIGGRDAQTEIGKLTRRKRAIPSAAGCSIR